MAFTKITHAGIGSTGTVLLENLEVTGVGTFGGSVSVGGTLTYEDVTNIDSVGLITARNGIVVGSGITLSKDGDGFFTGIVTATSFSGSGANLTSLPAQATIANNGNDRIITGGSGVNLNGEANLQFDGTDLYVSDNIKHLGDPDTLIQFATDTITFDTAGSETLRITSDGKIGINENLPGHKLTVGGDGYFGFTTPTDAARQVIFNANRGSAAQTLANINWQWNSKNVAQIRGIAGADTTNKDDGHLAFFTSSANSLIERLRITSAGLVGIGSGSPENKLKINVASGNDGIVVQNTSTANIALIGARNGDATLQIGQYGSTASGNVFGVAAANLAFMYTTSYGSTHPSALLIGNSSNKDIVFATNATERLRIDSSGNLLIGTTVTTNHHRLGNALVIAGTEAYTGASITQYSGTAAHKTLLDFNRSKGGSIGDMTTTANGDGLAHIVFRGSDGTNFVDSAGIRCDVDKVPSSNSVKGKISIETGSTGSANETLVATSDGHVQIPRQPYFVASAGAGRDNVTNQVLVFSSAIRNNGSHYDTSNSRFTAPVTGAYIFGGTPAYQETSDTMSIQIRKNGTTVFEVERVVAGSMNQHSAFGFSTLLYLSATDYVELYVAGQCHQNGSYSHWFGYLLG